MTVAEAREQVRETAKRVSEARDELVAAGRHATYTRGTQCSGALKRLDRATYAFDSAVEDLVRDRKLLEGAIYQGLQGGQ